MNNRNHIVTGVAFIVILMLMACVKDRNFDRPDNTCVSEVMANATYAEIKALYTGETIQIQQDLVIEGYVVSSDRAGNFFSTLYFQDSPSTPTEGFQIEVDIRDSHLFYPVGSKIVIKLKGLYLGRSKDIFKIGGVFTSFGNVSVGRLPKTVVPDHIWLSCDEKVNIVPTQVTIAGLEKDMTHTLVQMASAEILEEELGSSFALAETETERTIVDCGDEEISLLNSGFSDFYDELLPEGSGTITGVLLRENDTYQLAIRDLDDIDFSQERCADLVDEFTSTKIFISELADPDNNTGARFLELYNSGQDPLSLKGWTLRRYTNDNTEVSNTIDLSAHSILGERTFVISPNATEFKNTYGFEPDVEVGTNSAAGSNGDDNIELVDPFGNVIDMFGIIGEDGSGTNHEFEDGRAFRKLEVTEGSPRYIFSEWVIYNDSGNSGTIDLPQNAPEDFSPGARN